MDPLVGDLVIGEDTLIFAAYTKGNTEGKYIVQFHPGMLASELVAAGLPGLDYQMVMTLGKRSQGLVFTTRYYSDNPLKQIAADIEAVSAGAFTVSYAEVEYARCRLLNAQVGPVTAYSDALLVCDVHWAFTSHLAVPE